MRINPLSVAVLVLAGVVIGVITGQLLSNKTLSGPEATSETAKRKILYWVAPMDPDFRREKPGKSPMGMDLIPVYEGDASRQAAGTVIITPQVENNLGVRTAIVEQGEVTISTETVGVVQLDENKLHHLHTRMSGWVQKTWVKALGDRVEKGQPLLKIYSPELVNAQSDLVAAIHSENKTLIQATRERLKSLGIPTNQINQVMKTKKASDSITLYAEVSGYVNTLGVRDGMFVTPSTTLIGVGPLDPVWVEGELFPKQGGSVQLGSTATIRGDFAPGRSWQGKVIHILPKLDEQSRTLRVRVAVNNIDNTLRPGMFVRLQLGGEKFHATTIPRGALIRTGKMDRVVLAEGEGRYRSVRVEIGREFGDRVEILRGLVAGTRVVTSAQFLLDSESSISADFNRIDQTEIETSTGETYSEIIESAMVPAQAVWVSAKVLSMPDDNHYARLEHGPIPAWDWPAMTMGFYVADSASLDLRNAFETNSKMQVQLRARADGKYEVIAVRTESNVSSGGEGGEPAGNVPHQDHRGNH